MFFYSQFVILDCKVEGFYFEGSMVDCQVFLQVQVYLKGNKNSKLLFCLFSTKLIRAHGLL